MIFRVWKDERGATDVISVLLLLLIVVSFVILLGDPIISLFLNLMKDIFR